MPSPFESTDERTTVPKLAGVSYDKDAKCPKWGAHLRRIFANDDEFIRSFQELVMGTGSSSEIPGGISPYSTGRGLTGSP